MTPLTKAHVLIGLSTNSLVLPVDYSGIKSDSDLHAVMEASTVANEAGAICFHHTWPALFFPHIPNPDQGRRHIEFGVLGAKTRFDERRFYMPPTAYEEYLVEMNMTRANPWRFCDAVALCAYSRHFPTMFTQHSDGARDYAMDSLFLALGTEVIIDGKRVVLDLRTAATYRILRCGDRDQGSGSEYKALIIRDAA